MADRVSRRGKKKPTISRHICVDHCILLLQHLSTHMHFITNGYRTLFKNQLDRSKATCSFNKKQINKWINKCDIPRLPSWFSWYSLALLKSVHELSLKAFSPSSEVYSTEMQKKKNINGKTSKNYSKHKLWLMYKWIVNQHRIDSDGAIPVNLGEGKGQG